LGSEGKGDADEEGRLLRAPFFVFDEEAGIFDDNETSGTRFFCGSGVFDAELQPENFCADGHGGIGDGRNVFGAAEDIHDVNRLGNVLETGVGFLAEDGGFVGVDGNDAVAGGLQVGGDAVAGAGRVGGETNDSNGFGRAKDVGNGISGRYGGVGEMKFH
jgi:hypothetical protein